MFSYHVLDTILAALGLYLLKRLTAKRRPAPFPPGPKGLPVIGNLFDYPKEQRWKTFYDWKEKYGDIVHLDLLGQHVIILNSAQLATEMLDRKSTIYSERPFLFFASELVGWKDSVGLSPYGDRLRDMRRLLSKEIGSRNAVERYAAVSEAEGVRFLRRMLDDPSALQDNIRQLIASTILNISHGYQVESTSDPFVVTSDRVMSDLSKVFEPGTYLVDIVPGLNRLPNWFPGSSFKKEATEMRDTLHRALLGPYEYVKSQLAAGTARPSFVANHLNAETLSPAQETNLQHAAMALYDAGSDTTVSAVGTLFLAMTLYPEVQARARAEIDAVIGTDRLPGVRDRPRLPYIDALHLEVFRWQAIVPLSIAHASNVDDVHAGYFIPKGSYILANLWGFLHDPDTYRDPMEFNPSRFLGEEGRAPEQDPRAYVFGFGRRICPGVELADQNLFLACATVLAGLDISKARDEQGNEIVPTPEYTSGLLSHPKPFPCSIKPRSAKIEALVRAGDEASR